MTRTYTELSKLETLEERYQYLRLDGIVGEETFGVNRWLNQIFYKLPEWRMVRDKVITRDQGCELGVDGYDIKGPIFVHHMNPVTVEDILYDFEKLIDPEYLISSSKLTHDAIHYGNEDLLPKDYIERTKNDTCPWKR